MDKTQFQSLAQAGHQRIPVWRSVLADLDTPLSAYLKLADGPDTYLFESIEGGATWGRYSIIGLPCEWRYEFRGQRMATRRFGEVVGEEDCADPLERIRALQTEFRIPDLDELPGFSGGLVGYFGYETVGLVEPRLADPDKPDHLGTPDIVLLRSEELAVFDNLKGRLYLVVHADPSEAGAFEAAHRRLDQLEHRLRAGSPGYGRLGHGDTVAEDDFEYGFAKDEFLAAVARCKEYILAGDIFQVVLSQRMTVPFSSQPLDVYRALRGLNPSPYMYFVDLGDTQIVGSSPEVLVRVKDRRVVVRPIAGTRPRGASSAEDHRFEEDLLADPKERAEHLMLLDLGRNDVGRVAATGTVQVTDRMVIERYSHVMHIVTQVEGQLAEDLSAVDAVRAAFPAGTL
ncbi:MAG: chorismate-binding protein, partial [Xanthomonadales bacterium]|nr:chorismate-binding protein [Xanthomonadales bacterium]